MSITARRIELVRIDLTNVVSRDELKAAQTGNPIYEVMVVDTVGPVFASLHSGRSGAPIPIRRPGQVIDFGGANAGIFYSNALAGYYTSVTLMVSYDPTLRLLGFADGWEVAQRFLGAAIAQASGAGGSTFADVGVSFYDPVDNTFTGDVTFLKTTWLEKVVLASTVSGVISGTGLLRAAGSQLPGWSRALASYSTRDGSGISHGASEAGSVVSGASLLGGNSVLDFPITAGAPLVLKDFDWKFNPFLGVVPAQPQYFVFEQQAAAPLSLYLTAWWRERLVIVAGS